MKQEDHAGTVVEYVSLASVLGKRQIRDEAGRNAALADLGQVIDEALEKAEIVELI